MSDYNSRYTNQQKLVAALRDPRRYSSAVPSVQIIETHISWVILAGDYAYKIKKAINLGFLDYTELDARHFCCDEEIRLNRRTAPDIYLDTVTIGGSLGAPEFGAQPALEYAVRMRRFDSANLMDGLLLRGKISAQHMDRLAAVIARFHASLPAVDATSVWGTAASVNTAALQNFEQLRALLTSHTDRKRIAALEASTEAEYAGCREVFETRRTLGFVRECHGDLHLGNIVLIGDEPVPFDCIEFNPALRWIDVMDEIAFSVMDLLHRDHPELAWRLLNAYLEASGDYGGLSTLRFYLAYRATVRAKVCAIRASQTDISIHAKSEELAACRSYLALARQCQGQYRPALIITHGLPGSGKTTFSQLALQQRGAIRIRSDVERKRLFGLGTQENSRAVVGDIYGSEATRRTFARLHELARGILSAGFPVIVDAAFLKQEEREDFRELAQYMSVPFAIASLHADDRNLRERIQHRSNDASEADVEVLEMLRAAQQPLSRHELAFTAKFTTGEAPDSAANSQGWDKLAQLLSSV
jgi:aminoglycoside phosphotransferase family enzyme/predicted kinase